MRTAYELPTFRTKMQLCTFLHNNIMTRLVFETSEAEKAALAAALEPAGLTFTEWFEEQLATTITTEHSETARYTLPEAKLADALADPKSVAHDIANADWSFANDDTGFLTHDVHPYPAKYIPQIPGNLIRRLSCPGEVVLDPFGGSGTTATEAVRLGRRALSIDANPLATLIGRVKTGGVTPEDLHRLERLTTAVQTYLLDSAPTIDDDKLQCWIPEIPNIEKWFQKNITLELAHIRRLISELTVDRSRDIASLALSRIIVRVSNQDSETRYVAKDKSLAPRVAFKAFLDALAAIRRRVEQFTQLNIQGSAIFYTADSRTVLDTQIQPESVGLIVTSPPYPNATDYHLYHRFRIFWLGYDPRELGQIEIGSHLKHQRKQSGFEEYSHDMRSVLTRCYAALSAGRYAVLVVGDAMFGGEITNTAEKLEVVATEIGFEHVTTIERALHETRRSFSSAARRARSERLLVLRKPDRAVKFDLISPSYRLWDYEKTLRELELSTLLGEHRLKPIADNSWSAVEATQPHRSKLNRLTFSSGYTTEGGHFERTWQRLLENGDGDAPKRKEPKYVTHGIHAYKGKFYPQLAKSLLNISGANPGGIVLDPFSGSGTVLLESHLNGFQSYGCDINPLAVKIARAKTEILTLPPVGVDRALSALKNSLVTLSRAPKQSLDQFSPDVHDELISWFPPPVLYKMNWLLTQIRLFGDQRLVNFLEVILSDCIRECSHQEPTDLRIRRRAEPIEDAPLIEAFTRRLDSQHNRLKHFWSVASRRPSEFLPARVTHGSSREWNTYGNMGLYESSVDTVITSPPYATALPYIDTDRLSLMAILGMPSNKRKLFEDKLTGSREIATTTKNRVEEILFSESNDHCIPRELIDELRMIHRQNVADEAGFRRMNMPALLYRYFSDMSANIECVMKALKPGGKAYYVVGDSKTEVSGEWFQIRTTYWLLQIAKSVGLTSSNLINISVTTENMKHIRHAITENAVLCFEKPT
jgi:DNA modification methylase